MKKGQHCSLEFRKRLSDLAIGRESQTKGRKLKTKNRYSEIGKARLEAWGYERGNIRVRGG